MTVKLFFLYNAALLLDHFGPGKKSCEESTIGVILMGKMCIRDRKEQRQGRKVIVSSNVHSDGEDIVVNYHSLINRGYKYFENSTIMLLNLLKRIEVKDVYKRQIINTAEWEDVIIYE